MANNLDYGGHYMECSWHSVNGEGYPTDGTECLVTVEFFDGTRNVYDSYKYVGKWLYWSNQYEDWEDTDDNADEKVIAWMPYPEPYKGD